MQGPFLPILTQTKGSFVFLILHLHPLYPSSPQCLLTDGTVIKIRKIIILGQHYRWEDPCDGNLCCRLLQRNESLCLCANSQDCFNALRQVECAGISSLLSRMLAANLIKSESRCVKSSQSNFCPPLASALQLVVIFRVGTMNVAALLHKSKLLAKSNS